MAGLVDSGNNVCEVISEELYKRMGSPPLVPLTKSINTAKKGEGLQAIGIFRDPVSLKFLGLTETFKVRPTVVKGFNMDFNISGLFLHRHSIDQLHSVGALRYNKRRIPLFTQPYKMLSKLKNKRT